MILAVCVCVCVLQVRLLTVNDSVAPYAQEVAAEMRKHGLRVQVDGGASISKLIRNATVAKTPVTCVIGNKVRYRCIHMHGHT